MSLEQFVERWTLPNYPPVLVDEGALANAESSLGARLPDDYRLAILRCGLPRPTVALLDAVIESESGMTDVGDFLEPVSIVEVTRSWRASGLSTHLIAFANDSLGNPFCFSAQPQDGKSSVFYFDHDERSVEEVSTSFSAWIDKFAALPTI